MSEYKFVYLLWESKTPRDLTHGSLHGVYANRHDANTDAAVMQSELDQAYVKPTIMFVQAWPVDTKAVAG
jgi:hypothetical protein